MAMPTYFLGVSRSGAPCRLGDAQLFLSPGGTKRRSRRPAAAGGAAGRGPLSGSCPLWCCHRVTAARWNSWDLPEQSPSFHSGPYLDPVLATKTVNVNYSVNAHQVLWALEARLSRVDASWSSSSELVWQILHWSEPPDFLLVCAWEIKRACPLMGLLWDLVFRYSLDAKGTEKNHLKEWLSLPYFNKAWMPQQSLLK